MQKRSGIIGSEKHRQYHVFRDWVFGRLDALWQLLSTRYVLFGEWLWCQHAVAYDALPNFFLAFDIYDKTSQKFLCTAEVARMLASVSADADEPILAVPVLAELPLETSGGGSSGSGRARTTGLRESVLGHLGKASRFSASAETAEGVYVRLEDAAHVLDRWKIRRDTFVAGRADFAHSIINNTLA